VRGDVVGDGSYFDDAWFGEGWREEYRLAAYSAPIGALSFAENVVSVGVLPGAPGEPARIRTTPATQGLAVSNQVRTVASGATQVRFEHTEEGLTVRGQIARGHGGVTRSLTVVDPVNYAAAAFRVGARGARDRGLRGAAHGQRPGALQRHALGARSQADDGRPAPAGAGRPPLAHHAGGGDGHQPREPEPLRRGAAQDGRAGGARRGDLRRPAPARSSTSWSARAGWTLPTLRIVDGSGLSPLNRITARSTIQLLDAGDPGGVLGALLRLAPAGRQPSEGMQHSLRNRMGLTPAAGNARAKTGTIMNASSLSGYVRAANGERLAFAIYSNDVPSTALAKRMEDAAVIRLARFSRPGARPQPRPRTPRRRPRTRRRTPEPVEPPARRRTPPRHRRPPRGGRRPPRAGPAGGAAPAARTHRVRAGETLDGIARRYGTTVAAICSAPTRGCSRAGCRSDRRSGSRRQDAAGADEESPELLLVGARRPAGRCTARRRCRATSAGSGAAEREGHVRDAARRLGEEEEVGRPHAPRSPSPAPPPYPRRLLVGVARQLDAVHPEDRLHQPGAVHARRGDPAPEVGRAHPPEAVSRIAPASQGKRAAALDGRDGVADQPPRAPVRQ
jgi:hypothetical protein